MPSNNKNITKEKFLEGLALQDRQVMLNFLGISSNALSSLYAKVVKGTPLDNKPKKSRYVPWWLKLIGKRECTSCKRVQSIDNFYTPKHPCKRCSRDYASVKYNEDILKSRSKSREQYYKHRDKHLIYSKKKYAENKEWYSEYHKRYHTLHKDKLNAQGRARRQTFKGKALHSASERLRQASKLARTPVWAEIEAIKAFYLNRPKGYHVDHIIPLQGKLVSGLHCLANLQYLPAEENLAKSNKFNPATF